MNKILLTIGISALAACQRSRAPEPTSNSSAAVAPAQATSAPSAQGSPAPAGSAAATAANPPAFSFDTDQVGNPPSGFSFARTGSGRPGRWLVRPDDSAPSAPNVLAQLDDDATSFRFPVAVTAEVHPRDVRVSVRCKMISGRVDQACGLVLRYKNEKNYVITRANVLEGNIRLYTVRDGERDQIASYSGTVTANVWHEYRFEAKGDTLRVHWDGKPVLEHRDTTFMDTGAVGLWTKADSVTSFDDLEIEPL
jgi:hypothetical protein